MEQPAATSNASLGDFAAALRRRWWMVVLGAVLGVALASAYLLVAPKVYLATATVLVNPVGGSADDVVDGARTNSGVNLDTEAQLVKSQAVSSLAKVRLQTTEIVGQLVQRVTVAVPPNTNVLRITYSASTADDAREGASAFAEAYLENRRESSTDIIERQTSYLRNQVAQLENELPTQSVDQQTLTTANIQTLTTRLYSLQTAVTPGQIISDALLPRRPSSPNQLLVLFSGLALGILLGLAAVASREKRDGRLFDWRVVERRLGTAVLVDVPGPRGATPTLYPVHSPAGQAFTQVRNVLLSGMPSARGAILVASPEVGAGADAVAVNLAAAFARADHLVTLVVADSASTAPAMLGVAHAPGLAESLTEKVPGDALTQVVTGLPTMSVLAPGDQLHEKVDDLEGIGIAALLRGLLERREIVVVLAPATAVGADAQLLARLSDVAIPVVELGRTHREALETTIRQWQIVSTVVPGVVTLRQMGDGPDPIVGPAPIH